MVPEGEGLRWLAQQELRVSAGLGEEGGKGVSAEGKYEKFKVVSSSLNKKF